MHKVSFNFRKSLIDEIEDLADASSKLRQKFNEKIKNPFGVVSVVPYTNKAPSTEYGEMKSIEFLKEKLNSDTVFTVNETIQTTISAFQHLFQKEFNADEIQVSVMDPEYSVTDKRKDPTVEELNMGQISEHLDVINKRGKIEPCLEDTCADSRSPREWKLPSCSDSK